MLIRWEFNFFHVPVFFFSLADTIIWEYNIMWWLTRVVKEFSFSGSDSLSAHQTCTAPWRWILLATLSIKPRPEFTETPRNPTGMRWEWKPEKQRWSVFILAVFGLHRRDCVCVSGVWDWTGRFSDAPAALLRKVLHQNQAEQRWRWDDRQDHG